EVVVEKYDNFYNGNRRLKKMIELVNLSKTYKNTKAVNQMNMYIEKGEMIGLLGPNGAGKSTAISMLSTLIEPTEGDVLYKQKSVLKQPGPLREVIGFVPQEIDLYENISEIENLKFFGRLYRLTGKKLATRIEEVRSEERRVGKEWKYR